MTGSKSPTNPAPLLWVRLIATVVFLSGGALTAILLIAALFMHCRRFGSVGVIALAVTMLAQAATEAWRTYVLFKFVSWTTRDKRQATRAEQPVRFRVWLAVQSLCGGVYGAVACWLIYIGFGLWPR